MRVKNWDKFQHYHKRVKGSTPPWIKVYRDLLDDCYYHSSTPLAGKYLILIWLVASSREGILPPLPELAFRLRLDLQITANIIKDLHNFLDGDYDEYSSCLATCYANSSTSLALGEEKRGEERRKDKEPPIAPQGALYEEVISDLNQVSGKNYRLTKDVHKEISARLNEGFTVEDFKAVHRKMTAAWKGNEYEKYLRPSTLYRQSKFQGYLNYVENRKVTPSTSSFDEGYEGVF